jgi:hypothetical protein
MPATSMTNEPERPQPPPPNDDFYLGPPLQATHVGGRISPASIGRYDKIRQKAADLAAVGHNQLGELIGPVHRFRAALPEHIQQVQ